MSDPEIPVEGPLAGGRYRAVSDLPARPAAPAAPPTTPVVDPAPPGGDTIGAETEAVHGAATALAALGEELAARAADADALRQVELGPQGRDDDGDVAWSAAPVRPQPRAEAAPAAEAVPGLEDRRRRVAAELVTWDDGDSGPRRFAAQESERALHALAELWSRGLRARAAGLDEVARSGASTATALDTAGNV